MRTLVKRINANPSYSKLLNWGKLITVSAFMQVIVQVFSSLNGIIIIWLLPTKEYAFYTITSAMLGTMILLADGGIADAVMSQSGKAWKDPNWMGSVIVTGLQLRKRFAAVSLCVAVPILFYLLVHHEASILMTLLLIASLIPTFFIALSATILEIPPKIRQDILPLQKNQIALNAGRFVILITGLFAAPFSFVAVAASAVPQVWSNIRLRKMAATYVNKNQLPDPVIRGSILKIVKRTLPGAIYYCFYGQITTWLISIFGSTDSLAKVGALSRLAMILNVFTALFATLVIPRFARLAADRHLLLVRFLQVQISLLAIGGCVTCTVFFFPHQALFILGKNYYDLTKEVVIITGSSCIAMASGITYALSLARGWVLPPAINITGNVLTQLILLFALDLTKVQNVLWFSVINSAVGFIMLFGYYIYRVNKNPAISS